MSAKLGMLPTAAIGAWSTSCGECRYAAAGGFCSAYQQPVPRDDVGMRTRLAACLEAERKTKAGKKSK